MEAVYTVFAVALVAIGILGALTAALGIGKPALKRLELVATIIASLTAAGLLGLAFVVDKLTTGDISIGTFFGSPDGKDAFAAVVWQLAAGGVGLLVGLALAISESNLPRKGLAGLLLRWAGGCLAVSAVVVVLLFPATIVLILTAGDNLAIPAP